MKELAYWKSQKPLYRENKFLSSRKFLENLNHVDQIWDYLKDKCGDTLAVSDLRGTNKESLTYCQLSEYINKAAQSFFNLGLKRGDVVTLIAENSPRWLIIDQSLMRLGAIDAVRGCNAPSLELKYIIEHSKSIGLVIQSKEVWKKLENRDQLKNKLKFIIFLEGSTSNDCLSWNEFIKLSEKDVSSEYLNQIAKSKIDDVATVLYTSGTTGKPKGVPLTHSNFLHQIINLGCIADPKPGTTVLSVLPIWHSYERSAEYFFFSCGCSQFYTLPKFLKDDLKSIKPVVMATVPRLWEAIHDGFFTALRKMPPFKQKFIKVLIVNSSIFKKNLREINNLEIHKINLIQKILSFISLFLRFPFHQLSTKFLWPNILNQLCGDKLRFPINGGGALPEHVDLFFESLGVNVLVGYGLTETSPVLTCRRPWCNVRGSSGQALPFTEIKIVDDNNNILKFKDIGRVLVRGPQVMGGYLNDIESSLKVLSLEGWFDTGDLGFLIPNGSLIITGRGKDTIVLSSGENIEPNPIEIEVLGSQLINQIQLLGQDQKNLTALVVPNIEFIEKKFSTNNLKKINKDKEIKNFFKLHINTRLKNRIGSRIEEQIVDLIFVKPFTLENNLLTQTLKQKRKEIEKLYENKIEEMYKKQIKGEKIL